MKYYVVDVLLKEMLNFNSMSSALEYCEHRMYKYEGGEHYLIFDESGKFIEEYDSTINSEGE